MKKYPWWNPILGEKEKKYLNKVFEDNYPNEGSYTLRFEKKIGKLINSKHVISTTSGTSALFLSMKAIGIGKGDEVIVPNITFIATANAVDMCGAKPVFADVLQDTLNINFKCVEKLITKKTKAIIPVHISGRPVDILALKNIKEKYGVTIIEDSAEAFMSKQNDRFLGTLFDFGIYSFSPNKIITTGQGGAIVTNNEVFANRLYELKDQGRPVRGTGGNDVHFSKGYNFKFSNIHAAIGLGQLSYLDQRIERAKKTYNIYSEELSNINQISILPFNLKEGNVPLWVDVLCDSRDELIEFLKGKKIDCRKFWHPINTQKPYHSDNINFPISVKYGYKAFWLPSAYTLDDSDVHYICKQIKSFF